MDYRLSYIECALHAGWVGTPKNEVIRSETWAQLTTPGSSRVLQNGVFRSVLDEGEVASKIEQVIEGYRALGVPFWWVVTPLTRPCDMAARLTERGFQLTSRAMGMCKDPRGVVLRCPEGVTVEEVSAHNIEEWARVQAEGWGPDFVEDPLVPPPPEQRIDVLVRSQGQVAGAGSILFLDGFTHLLRGVTLPAFRGRGVFRACVERRLEIAAERGAPVATSHCLAETSAPIYRRLGFEEVCELAYYRYGP